MRYMRAMILTAVVAAALSTLTPPCFAQPALSPLLSGTWTSRGAVTFTHDFRIAGPNEGNPIYSLFAGAGDLLFIASPQASGAIHASTQTARYDSTPWRNGLARWIPLAQTAQGGGGFLELQSNAIQQFDARGTPGERTLFSTLPNWPAGQSALQWSSAIASDGALQIWIEITGGRQAFLEWRDGSIRLVGWLQLGNSSMIETARYSESGPGAGDSLGGPHWSLQILREQGIVAGVHDGRVRPLNRVVFDLFRDSNGFFSARRPSAQTEISRLNQKQIAVAPGMWLVGNSRSQTVSLQRRSASSNTIESTVVASATQPFRTQVEVEIVPLMGARPGRFAVKTQCEVFVLAINPSGGPISDASQEIGRSTIARAPGLLGQPYSSPGICNELTHLVAIPGGFVVTDSLGGRLSFFRVD